MMIMKSNYQAPGEQLWRQNAGDGIIQSWGPLAQLRTSGQVIARPDEVRRTRLDKTTLLRRCRHGRAIDSGRRLAADTRAVRARATGADRRPLEDFPAAEPRGVLDPGG